jgi:hypothetical protein
LFVFEAIPEAQRKVAGIGIEDVRRHCERRQRRPSMTGVDLNAFQSATPAQACESFVVGARRVHRCLDSQSPLPQP